MFGIRFPLDCMSPRLSCQISLAPACCCTPSPALTPSIALPPRLSVGASERLRQLNRAVNPTTPSPEEDVLDGVLQRLVVVVLASVPVVEGLRIYIDIYIYTYMY